MLIIKVRREKTEGKTQDVDMEIEAAPPGALGDPTELHIQQRDPVQVPQTERELNSISVNSLYNGTIKILITRKALQMCLSIHYQPSF